MESTDPYSHSQNFLFANYIRDNKDDIVEHWLQAVLKQVPASNRSTIPVIIDSLGVFLDELANELSQENPSVVFLTERAMSTIHGGERASLEGYYLPQLLKEFSILRGVLNENLKKNRFFQFDVRNFIDKALDHIVSAAAAEFVAVQNERLRFALQRAERSNHELEQFAAIAAHDLKSPLATISSFLELLDDEHRDSLPADAQDMIQTMKKTSTRMLNLIDRLLEYAHISGSNRPMNVVNLNDVMESVLQNLSGTVERESAEISFGTLPMVYGDPELLGQLFQNLIANAIKFHSKEKPRITIATTEREHDWLFSVKDNGIGFDPKEKDSIFALYKKLHGNEEFQGSGIGLATCRKVVELHGGKIWAESEIGVGSTFYFSLGKNRDY